MSAKQIILAMVKGLENPTTQINMDTFGISVDNVCYGCAATNTICRIEKISNQQLLNYFNTHSGFSTGFRYYHFKNENKETARFIEGFECAIDYLRQGLIPLYNREALDLEIATIKKLEFDLPILTSKFTSEELDIYKKLANEQ